MKRAVSVFMVILICSCFVVPANATEVYKENKAFQNVISAEIPNETAAAEVALDGSCELKDEKIEEAGDYIVVNRLYSSTESQARAGARTIGGLSSVTWYKRGERNWTYKVRLAGWFDYDGTEAECVDYSFTAVDASYDSVGYYIEPRFLSGKIAAVNVYSEIADEKLAATLHVSCTKDGDVEYRSLDAYF